MANSGPWRAQQVRQAEKHGDDGIGLGVEVAQHRGELRQYEQDEEQQHQGRGEQDEGRILQGVAQLAPRRLAARAFDAEHFEDLGELARGLADLHQRHIDRREQGRMAADRLGEALAGEHAGADLRHRPAQPADVLVGGEQFEPVVEPRARLEQQREVAGENGDVLGARRIEGRQRDARGRAAPGLGDRIDGNEAEIFDAMGDFADGRGRDRADDDLAALGQCAIAEIRHCVTAPSSRAGLLPPKSGRRGTWRRRRRTWWSSPLPSRPCRSRWNRSSR